MFKEYKSSLQRLVKLFKKSRDQWKQKAAEKQEKLRAQEVRIRDLQKSRDVWKQRAKTAQQQLKDQERQKQTKAAKETELETKGMSLAPQPEEQAWELPKGHHYPTAIIQIAVAQIIKSCSSLRGVAHSIELWSQHLQLSIPSYSSIRQWLLRIGLYELQRPREQRKDWIYILDLTTEMGPGKCLAVLGLAQSDWQSIVEDPQRSLTYQDLEVLAVEVLDHSPGKVIAPVLEKVSQQVGQPLQIVSDHGSDLKKGIELYLENHPQVIYTYDVTHQVACLLKSELENDERYQSFISRCARTRQQLQQTELSFLLPPTQRSKSRYLNVDSLVKWANQSLMYQKRADFSQINSCFCLDEVAFQVISPLLAPETLAQLKGLEKQSYNHRNAFTQALKNCLHPQPFSDFAEVIIKAADLGRRRFQEKLGWLSDYQTELATYTQMLALAQTLQTQLKQQGLTNHSKAIFMEKTQSLALSPRLQGFKTNLLNYLEREASQVPPEKTLLASSDIIESIFGKYKILSGKSPLKQMGHLLLTLPLITAKLSCDLVKTAMETVSFAAVETWFQQVFGLSSLSKRRAVFASTEFDTDLA